MHIKKVYTNEASDAFYQNKLWAVVHNGWRGMHLISAALIGGSLTEYKNPATARNWGFTTATDGPVEVSTEDLIVSHHHTFQVWIGLDPKYTRDEMKQILASGKAGTLVLSPVAANKVTLKVF